MKGPTCSVLKLSIAPGVFRRKLIKELNSFGREDTVTTDPGTGDWIYYGPEQVFQGVCTMKSWVLCGKDLGVLGRNPRHLEERLRICGITSDLNMHRKEAGDRTGYIRRFVVRIFHLKAIDVVRIGPEGQAVIHRDGEWDRESKLWRRLERTAVRTLYALGLDMGEVKIAAGEEGRFTVYSVSAVPDTSLEGTIKKYALAMYEALKEWRTFDESEPRFLIGMDPEFLLFDRIKQRIIPASRFLSPAGEAGCDAIRYQGRRLFPLVELRPSPGKAPREIITHLLHAFRKAGDNIGDQSLLWQAGAMPQRGLPLGGHIHFSGLPLSSNFLRTLDNYLALPVAVVEASSGRNRRPKYGFLGDFRLQHHGGFEYRTLPSFLVSPLVTKGVVALARLIVDHHDALTARPLDDHDMISAFYSGDKDRLRVVLPQLIQDITSLDGYSAYANYLDPFLEAVASGRTWDESKDIRKRWKM